MVLGAEAPQEKHLVLRRRSARYKWMSFVVLRVTLRELWLSRHFDSESTVY